MPERPSAPPWGGIRGYFADPDGIAWEVAWNPGMQADADGRFEMTGVEAGPTQLQAFHNVDGTNYTVLTDEYTVTDGGAVDTGQLTRATQQ